MANKKITYNIGFNVDSSGLQQAKTELQNIQNMNLRDLRLINAKAEKEDLEQIKQAAKAVGAALEDSLNPKLGTINVDKFNQSLKNSGQTIGSIERGFANLSTAGTASFRNLTAQILTTQREIKQSNKFLDSMATTLGNTIKWSIASGAINMFTSSIRNAWNYVIKLDGSLNDIRIVTEKSSEEMEKFAAKANKAAKALGAQTTAYTKASLIYYQQGLGEDDVEARTNVTIKAANVTGQSAAEVSEQLTAVWNGYKVAAEEAELYVDKLSAVAASTAADLEELSDGMSKVASGANAMGVDIDQLTAQLATIVSVTRQDASVVGTALKTIFARMGDLKVDGVDEFGVSLGDVSGTLKKVGIDVLDTEGNLRDMGTVIEEVAGKWGGWTEAQQQAVAVAIAGKRQYNNLLALFENWDMYESALSTSQGSAGTLQKQQDIYMDSLDAKLQGLKTSGEAVYKAMFDSESMKDLISLLTNATDKFAAFTNAIGGGGNLLLGFGSIAARVFSNHIAQGISRALTNFGLMRQAIIQNRAELEIQEQYGDVSDEAAKKMVAIKEKELANSKLLTEEQKKQFELYIKQTAELHNQVDAEEEKARLAREYAEKILHQTVDPNAKTSKKGVLTADRAANQLDASAGAMDTQLAAMGSEKSFSTKDFNQRQAATELSKGVQILENSHPSLQGLDNTALQARASELAAADGADNSQEISDINELIQKREALQKVNDALKESEEKIDKAMQELIQSGKLSKEEHSKLITAKVKLAKGDITLVDAEKALRSALENTSKEHKKQAEQLRKGNKEINTAKDRVKNLEKSYKSFLKNVNTAAAIQGFTNVTSAIGSMATAWNAFKNIGKIWDDETLSTGEKLTQTLMAVGSATAMAANGYKGAKDGILQLVGAFGAKSAATAKDTAIEALNTAVTKASTEADKKAAIAEFAKAQAIDLSDDQLKDQTSTELLKIVTDKLYAKSANEVAKANAKMGLSASATVGPFGAMGTAAWASLGPYAIIIAIVIAALAVLIGMIMIFTKMVENSDNGQKAFDRAAEAAKNATEEFNNVKAAYEELKKSLEDYNKAQDAIEKLTKGTDEWRAAIEEANSQVLELMDKYPELAEYVSNVDGQLKISEEGQEKVLEAQENAVRQANRMRLTANINKARAENEMTRLQGANTVLDTDKYENKADVSKIVGYATGSLLGGLLVGTGVAAEREADRRQAAYDKAIEVIQEHGNSVLESEEKFAAAMGESNADLIDELLANKQELIKNSVEIAANTKAIQIQQQQDADSYYLEHSDAYKNSEYQSQISKIIGTEFKMPEVGTAEYKAILDEYADGKNTDKKLQGVGEAEKVAESYFDAMGITYKKGSKNLVWDNKNRTITYQQLNEEGEYEEKVIDIDNALEFLAKEDYYKGNLNKIGELDKIIGETISAATEKYGSQSLGAAIKNLVGGEKSVDLTSLTGTEISSLGSFDADNAADVKKVLANLGLTEQEVKLLGYENGKAYVQALEASIANYRDEEGSLSQGLTKSAKTAFNTLKEAKIFEDWSLTTQQAIAESLQNAFEQGGPSAVTAVKNLYSQLGDISNEDAAKISEAIGEIDWTSSGALLELTNKMKELGVEIPVEALNGFANEMAGLVKPIKEITAGLDSLINKFKSFGDLTKDLEVGKVISTENYENLIKYNAALADYFVLTAEGYKYMGGADAVIKATNQSFLNIKDVKNKFASAEALGQGLLSSGDFDRNAGGDTNKIGQVANLLKAGGYGDLFEASGYSSAQIQEALTEKETYEAIAKMSAKDYVAKYGGTEAAAQTAIDDAAKRRDNANSLLLAVFDKVSGSLGAIEEGTFSQNLDDALTMAASAEAKNYQELLGLKDQMTEKAFNTLATAYLNEEAKQLGINEKAWEALKDKTVEQKAAIVERRRALQAYDEVNMYEMQEKAIEKTEQALENLAEQQEKVFGDELNKNIEKQVALQKELLAIAKEKYETRKNELSLRRSELQDLYSTDLLGFGVGLSFDGDGAVSAESYQQIQALLLTDLSEEERTWVEAILSDIDIYNEKVVKNLDEYQGKIKESFDRSAQMLSNILEKELTLKIDLVNIKEAMLEIQNELNRIKFNGKASMRVFDEKTAEENFNDAQAAYGFAKDRLDAAISTFEKNRNSYNGLEKYLGEYSSDKIVANGIYTLNNIQEAIDAQKEKVSDAEAAVRDFATSDFATSSTGIALAEAKKKAEEELEKKRKLVEDKADAVTTANDKLQEAQLTKTDADTEVENAKKALSEAESLGLRSATLAYLNDTWLGDLSPEEVFSEAQIQALMDQYSSFLTVDVQKEKDALDSALAKQEWALGALELAELELQNATSEKTDADDKLREAQTAATEAATAYNDAEKSAQDTLQDTLQKETDALNQLTEIEANLKRTAQENATKAAEGLAEGLKTYAIINEDGSVALDKQKYEEEMMSSWNTVSGYYQELMDQLEAIYDTWGQAQEEILALYEKEIDKRSTLNSMLSSTVELYELLGDRTADYADNMKSYYAGMLSNSKSNYLFAQQQVSVFKDELEKTQAAFAQGIASKEMLETAEANYNSALETMYSSAKEWADLSKEALSGALGATIDEFVAKTSDLKHSLSEVQEDWSRAKEWDERDLDRVNATYGINSLLKNIDKSIDETDNYSAQKKLAELRAKQEERLNKILEERGKLSQYELDRANAEYELTLKRIALEEAQMTASKMKLVRDASGNYSYQYVADQDKISAAEDAVAKAENDLYNLDKNRQAELIEEYYKTLEEYQADLANGGANKETYAARLLEIQEDLGTAGQNLNQVGQMLMMDEWTAPFEKFAESITSSNLQELFASMDSVVSELSSLTDLDSVLGETGAITQSIVSMSTVVSDDILKGVKDIAATSQGVAANVINQLPGLLAEQLPMQSTIDAYKGIFDGLEDKVDSEITILGAIKENTAPLKDKDFSPTLNITVKSDGSIETEGDET